MRTLRNYLWREIAAAAAFVLLALTAIFAFFDLVNQMGNVGHLNYRFEHALIYVLLSAPGHSYELMPIAALIGTVYALSKLAANSEFTIMRVSGMTTQRLAQVVLQIGLGLVAVAYVTGEFIAPAAEEQAQLMRAAIIGSGVGREFRSGVWVRDLVRGADGQPERIRFVNVLHVEPDGVVYEWRIFEFDQDMHMRSMSTASHGTFRPDEGWLLSDYVATDLPLVDSGVGTASPPEVQPVAATQIQREKTFLWHSTLTPAILGILAVQPERQSVYSLFRYIRHLAENHQRTDRYEVALWKKILYPLVCLVMMTMALPFAYLHVRAGSVSLKIFVGIMIGVAFHAMNKMFSNLGAINDWPPVLIAGFPAMVAFAVALGALFWVERR